MDACPIYSVRVQGDGSVLWNGQSGVQVKGAATRQVLAQAARALIESYRAAGFWCLSDRGYGEDGPEVTTTVHIGDREKTIKGTPDWKIYRSVGALAGTYYWIRGDPQQESVNNPRLSDNNFAPKPGVTDLMRAASAGDVSAMKQELMAGAKVDAQDSSGFTALMYATRTRWQGTGNRSVLEFLLKAGADPNLRSNRGQTAMMAAITGPRASPEALELLIASGGDVNAQDNDGMSALMMAAPSVEPTLVSFLVKAGARRDARDAKGQTASSFVSTALWSVDNEIAFLKNHDVRGGAERLGGLEMRRQRLDQVRAILVEP